VANPLAEVDGDAAIVTFSCNRRIWKLVRANFAAVTGSDD
jgi:hypothetical protein